jgi:N-acetyl-beta-hexosaminidase
MEGTMFSETIRTSENVDYMLFPRLVALAERAWHKAGFEDESISLLEREDRFSREWEDFANTLGYKELQRLDNLGIKYRVPPPGARFEIFFFDIFKRNKASTITCLVQSYRIQQAYVMSVVLLSFLPICTYGTAEMFL